MTLRGKRKLKAWWSICDNCQEVKTGIGYSIHNRYSDCKNCGDVFNYKSILYLDSLNSNYEFLKLSHLEYGIAWGME